MSIEIDAVMEVITQAVIEATKAAVQAVMVERGDETTSNRSELTGMRPKLSRPPPAFNFTKEVKNICETHIVDQAEKMPVLKNS